MTHKLPGADSRIPSAGVIVESGNIEWRTTATMSPRTKLSHPYLRPHLTPFTRPNAMTKKPDISPPETTLKSLLAHATAELRAGHKWTGLKLSRELINLADDDPDLELMDILELRNVVAEIWAEVGLHKEAGELDDEIEGALRDIADRDVKLGLKEDVGRRREERERESVVRGVVRGATFPRFQAVSLEERDRDGGGVLRASSFPLSRKPG
ncbi:hypothetical protein CC78DRAFT_577290 [Lojkania enalia]|uniref:Uncharacterized protein n=1 Tax=Lojkania enalia TaxID=147567 RepID=A0A9P4KG26_9PLEO|nr:hypothetical protein CC78DRAFT_577290 [Didymosphaeria enalia]